MPKTFNFSFGRKLTVFSLALCLLVVCASGAAAQQSKAIEPCSATPSGSPAAKLKKAAAAPAGDAKDVAPRVSETEINSTIPDDPAVDKVLEPYLAKVRALDVVIGKLDGELKKVGMGGGSLGNFVADGMRAKASIT